MKISCALFFSLVLILGISHDGLADERTCLRGPIGLRGGCTKYSCVEACVEQFGSSENGICMANGACCCKI
ncbi:hypothetical protein BVRB_016440 [Beta vulgaris subsp. vulgaris]|uniref:Knottin scorpion toxin-like domain-containing protein n=1 Tax=Beta vulgaris subsp. vulgaris TaxID=3555 RepID=A0A0J8B0Y7_BETVV|nr:hypothetical protein BVRB_016440 [Beta vulgaris subsp. vulgaris]